MVTKFKYHRPANLVPTAFPLIDRHLTWHDHIEQLQSKIATRLGVLKRIKHLLPVYARGIYVSTMVISILEYASIVWVYKNNIVLMDSIQVLQNKAAKLAGASDAFFFNPSTFRSELNESISQKINATVFFYA